MKRVRHLFWRATFLAVVTVSLPALGERPGNAQTPTVSKSSTQNQPTTRFSPVRQPVDVTHMPPVQVAHPVAVQVAKDPKTLVDHVFDWGPWVFNLLLAGVGIYGIRMALRTVKQIEKQTDAQVLAERAWVLVKMGELPTGQLPDPTLLSCLWIMPTVENKGRTVAQLTGIECRPHTVQRPTGKTTHAQLEKLPAIPDYSGLGSVKADWSNGRLLLAPNETQQPINVVITGEDYASVIQGNMLLYVYGRVTYRDTLFGDAHETRFCYLYWVPGGFAPGKAGWAVAGETPSAYFAAT